MALLTALADVVFWPTINVSLVMIATLICILAAVTVFLIRWLRKPKK